MRLITVTAWILGGAALTGGAYWTFLITPESTVWALAASALMLLASAFLLALTINGAIVGWRQGVSTSHVRTAVSGIPAILPAAVMVAAIWWLTGLAMDRLTMTSGPISAWFIAAFGWADVSWLFTGAAWLAAWLRWVVAPLLAVSLMAGIVGAGWRTVARIGWLRHALSPLTLAVATVVFAVLIAVPWTYLVPWRPAGLPASGVELAFIIGKLSLTALIMAVGIALIIRQASWTTSTPSSAN